MVPALGIGHGSVHPTLQQGLLRVVVFVPMSGISMLGSCQLIAAVLEQSISHQPAHAAMGCAGTKPELAVRILARFQLACPCAAPLLVVAHSRYHAIQMLSGLEARYSYTYYSDDPRFTEAQREECRQLTKQWAWSAPQALQEAFRRPAHSHLSADMQHEAEARAAAVALGLRKAFCTFAEFRKLLGFNRVWEDND